VRIWTRADAPSLCALVDLTLPGERLSADEIVAACFEDPERSAVIGLEGGEGAVAVVARTDGDRVVAHLLMLAVEPAAQGQGRGRRLLAAAEEWAFDGIGADEVHAGGSLPFGPWLWPGVDVRWTRSLCLFEAAGYSSRGVSLVLSCPSTHRAEPPDGVDVRRVLADDDAAAALVWSDQQMPAWAPVVGRAVDHGSCFVASADGRVLGLICHSVNRAGWVGPVGVSADKRGRGVGRALLGAACRDLRDAGLPDVYISPPEPLEFFVRSAGASVSRVFCRLARARSQDSAEPGAALSKGRR
jgi:GNAT superfamily N-acetyltransferase